MWFLVVAMLVILVLAGLVVLYVAFPHRGEDVPHVPWLGRRHAQGRRLRADARQHRRRRPTRRHEPLDLQTSDQGSPERRGRDA